MLQKLTFKPGINRENTNYTNEGGWYDMDKVRFRRGTPEKIGGWSKAGTGTFQGVARNLVCWATLTGDIIIGIGTSQRYYVNYGGQYRSITPVRTTATLVNPFLTNVNSTTVRVTHTAHGAEAGDMVNFSGSSATGGIPADVLNRTDGFRILSVIDANTYTIDVEQIASSTVQGGGAGVFTTYELHTGLPVYSIGSGWGAGYWNGPVTGVASTTLGGTGRVGLNATDATVVVASTSGFSSTGTLVIDSEIITYTGTTSTTFTGCTRGANGSNAAAHHRPQLSASTWRDIPVEQVIGYSGDTGWGDGSEATFGAGPQLRLWSSSNYGEDLIIAPRGGAIYYWTKDIDLFTRAQALRDDTDLTLKFVPHTVNAIMVSDVSRFVIALGANPYDPGNDETVFDPMLVRWSHQSDPTDWIPEQENQAGEQRLSAGSYVMTGVNMNQQMLVWTDAALYSMQYIGPPYVWNIQLIMSNLSLMSPNAVAVVNNTAFWMGADKFYVYNGRVDTLPCAIHQYVFNDLSFSQRFQTCAGTNEGFNEIWWFYVSNTEVTNATHESREPTADKYVVYNHAEQCWYYGNMNRTAWLDTPLYQGPLAATGDSSEGVLVMHEQGTDDNSGDTPTAISAYIQSSDFDIGDGHQFMFVWRTMPDVSFNGSVVPNPQCTLTLAPRQNAGSTYGSSASGVVTSGQIFSPTVKQYTVQQFTQQLNTRVRGRAMALRIESNALGVQWQLGAPRIDARPDGRKS
jgi:hypothetical protein